MSDMIKCEGCGKEMHRTAGKCPHCGYSRLRGTRYKSKNTAGILALLLGGLGIHRFYLGQWWGIFYLLTFWLAIPAFIALIEAIVILCTDQEKWDEKYNDGIAGEGSSSAAIVIVAVVAVFIVVAFIGILAAIAIPAYQDYTIRARIAGAMSYAGSARAAVTEHVERARALPVSLQEVGFNDPPPSDVGTIEWDPQYAAIIVTMRGTPAIEGKAFAYQLKVDDGQMSWACRPVDVPNKYLPSGCRIQQ